MRKFKFITSLRFLEISEPMDVPFTLMPGINIINNSKKIKELLDDEFLSVAGSIEATHQLNANHILYCETDENVFSKTPSSNDALIKWLIWLEMLISDSWLIKDNAMACEVAFCKMSEATHTEWSSNYLSNPVSVSSGEQYKTTEFNIKDLKEWEAKCHKLQSYLHNNNSGVLTSFTNKQHSRIGRSRRFISAARKEPHPAIKISHYCSAFESLFSTDNAELSHKLSERVALFLTEHGYKPMSVFEDMKVFYGVRSKVTHGDNLQSSREMELGALSNKCDSYLRSIFNVILDDIKLQNIFDGKKDEHEQYFNEMLFAKYS